MPKYTISDTIKRVHVLKQQVGAPKSRRSAKECVKTHLPNTRASKMNGAYSIYRYLTFASKKQRVGGCGHFSEDDTWVELKECLLLILIEVAIIQVSILGADEE